MLIYNLTKERLAFKNFEHFNLDWAIQLGFLIYRKGHINVFLKAYPYDVSVSDIIKDALRVRKEAEKDFTMNVWNSYMLVCLEQSDEYFDLLMKIERDTTAIRKYLICKGSDLDRIPFLDITEFEIVKPGDVLRDETLSNLKEIKDLVIDIRELTFQEGGKIAPKKIKQLVENKYLKEPVYNENKGS